MKPVLAAVGSAIVAVLSQSCGIERIIDRTMSMYTCVCVCVCVTALPCTLRTQL